MRYWKGWMKMSDLEILDAMMKQYDDDIMMRTEFGEELVSSEMLKGEKKLIRLVSDLIDRNIRLMEEEDVRKAEHD